MTDLQINAMMGAMQRQRDAALNEVVALQGQMAVLNAELTSLREQVKKQEPEAPAPAPVAARAPSKRT